MTQNEGTAQESSHDGRGAHVAPDATIQALEALDADCQRLANDLHDAVGSALIAARLRVAGLVPSAAQCEAGLSPEHVSGLANDLRALERYLAETHRSVRRIVHGLGTEALACVSLVAAVRDFVSHIENMPLAPKLSVIEKGAVPRLPPREELHIFRFVQGALANVLAHSGARFAAVTFAAKGSGLSVTVEDFGRGFDVSAHARSFGLSSLRARAVAVGAEFTLESKLDEGTLVRLVVPITQSART